MAKTWEQIISEIEIVSEEQSKKDRNELLESMGMTWFDFMQTEEYQEIAKKIAEVRYARITNRLMVVNRDKINKIFEKQKKADEEAEAAASAQGEEKTEATPAEEQPKADEE